MSEKLDKNCDLLIITRNGCLKKAKIIDKKEDIVGYLFSEEKESYAKGDRFGYLTLSQKELNYINELNFGDDFDFHKINMDNLNGE